MNRKKSIDVIIIAKNESARIAQCIKRLSFAQKIFVIDNNSTDNTADVARKAGARVIRSDSSNFSDLRNLGALKSTADWLLYIDADEFVGSDLRIEILDTIEEQSDTRAYRILRDNYYLGYLWPTHDGMIRLIHRASLRAWEGTIHEHASIEGTVDTLQHHLVHDTHRTLHEMTEKTNEWSAIEAQLRFDADHPAIVEWRLLRVMITGFMTAYVKDGGWRMGTVGLIESIFQSFSMFTTYAKLWELQQNKNRTTT
jgi:glycosyltransferase involved in cell wall biosynthesis